MSRIEKRWEDGVDHDPRSIALYKSIARIDFEECDDSFGFKSGGDGDNGETLMFLLDCHFEDEDKKKAALKKITDAGKLYVEQMTQVVQNPQLEYQCKHKKPISKCKKCKPIPA